MGSKKIHLVLDAYQRPTIPPPSTVKEPQQHWPPRTRAFTLKSYTPFTDVSPTDYFTDATPNVKREDAPLASTIAHIEQRSVVVNVSKHFLMCFSTSTMISRTLPTGWARSRYYSTVWIASRKARHIWAGKLYLEGIKLNNATRRNRLIEIFAKALPFFPDIIRVKLDISTHYKYDPVAELLFNHQQDSLRHFSHTESVTLESFLAVYKKINSFLWRGGEVR
jgi:hypothetical protein